jgi:uncharacterized membrane protein YfcA
VLLASALFALQPVLARRLREREQRRVPHPVHGLTRPAVAGTFAAAIYGAYFGGGLGVILLAILGLALDDELVRINGVRSVLSLVINTIAVVVFVVAADVAWGDVAVLAATALVGGYTGARLSRRLPVPVLRAVVVALGLAAAVKLLA